MRRLWPLQSRVCMRFYSGINPKYLEVSGSTYGAHDSAAYKVRAKGVKIVSYFVFQGLKLVEHCILIHFEQRLPRLQNLQ